MITLRHSRERIEKLRAIKANYNAVNLKEQAERFGLLELEDVPFRSKRVHLRRNACKTKKRHTGGKKTKTKYVENKNVFADFSGFEELLK